MKLQARLLFASVAAALLITSRVVVVVVVTAGSAYATVPALRGSVEEDAGLAAEREVEEAAYPYPQRRVLYSPQYVGYNGLQANQAACYGSCPAQGQPYSGNGCQPIYGCRGR